jgi:hypothetical protein
MATHSAFSTSPKSILVSIHSVTAHIHASAGSLSLQSRAIVHT